MITTNVLQRTFQVKYGNATGTCFTIEINNRQYLVTARHVVDGIRQQDTINLYHEQTWKPLRTTITCISQTEEDIAILVPEIQLSPTYLLEPTATGLALGQDVYFCGYPYGLRTNVGALNRSFPIPLVKKGIVSSVTFEKGHQIIVIDGHNNPGFSGGPVVFAQPRSSDYKVAGVISGYRVEYEPVLMKRAKTGLEYEYNTGLVIAYGLKNGIEHITKNPTGINVKTA